MVKPDRQSHVDTDYPIVCLKEDSADNEYSFRIMHDLNHQNILSMTVLCDNKLSDDPRSIATFVEPYHGLLRSVLHGENFADWFGHIPSQALQSYLRY